MEFLRHAFLHKDARTGAADLALVEPDRIDHAFDSPIEIGVVEHDERRLATQLQRQRLARTGGLLADDAADLRRAGECDLVDPVMLDDQRTCFAFAGHDVQHARRQAGSSGQFGKQERRQRGEFGGLEDHGIAQRQCWRDLPGEHQQRKIPRDDLADHTNRHMVGEFAFLQLRPACVMVEMPGGERHVDVARLANRLAVVDRLDHGQQPAVALDHPGKRIEMPRPLVAGKLRPLHLGLAGGRDRCIDIVPGADCELGEIAAGRRLMGDKGLVAGGRPEFAIDEMTEHAVVALDPAARFGIGFGGGAV
jgi:hypothetical protein